MKDKSNHSKYISDHFLSGCHAGGLLTFMTFIGNPMKNYWQLKLQNPKNWKTYIIKIVKDCYQV